MKGEASSAALAALLALISMRLAPSDAPAPAGYVADVHGEWVVSGHTGAALAMGAQLAAGDTVKAGAGANAGQRIAVLLKSGQLRTAQCSGASTAASVSCGTIVIPRETPSSSGSWLSRALDAIMSQFRSEPDRYTSLVTRGVHGPPPEEAVLMLRRDSLVLAPALTRLPAGQYTMCIARITDRPTAREASECLSSFDVTWNPPRGGTVHTTGLRPGLYQLLDVHGQTVAGAAWVLVTGPAQFPNQHAAFDRMKATATKWQSDSLPAATVRQMLRAQLAALAQPAGH